MKSDQSRDLYEQFVETLKKSYRQDVIFTGQFGAHMKVHFINEGYFFFVFQFQLKIRNVDDVSSLMRDIGQLLT